jgi:hypothetical protein
MSWRSHLMSCSRSAVLFCTRRHRRPAVLLLVLVHPTRNPEVTLLLLVGKLHVGQRTWLLAKRVWWEACCGAQREASRGAMLLDFRAPVCG